MTPSDKEFGELIGAVKGLESTIAEMRRENADDHAAVVTALSEVRREIAAKADNARVNKHADRIDKLESERDVWRGRSMVLGVLGGAVVTGIVSLLVGLIFIAIGGGG